MQLDEADLNLLHHIANARYLLSAKGSRTLLLGRDLAASMRRRTELQQELDHLIEQWLSRGLLAAGFPEARDPASLPEPEVWRRAQRNFCPPERPSVKALEIPEVHK